MLSDQVASEFIPIPSQTFLMGSSKDERMACVAYWSRHLVDPRYTSKAFSDWIAKEEPKHPVRVPLFAIGRFLVTNEEYQQFCQETQAIPPASIQEGEPGNHPVWGVNIHEAREFAKWKGQQLNLPLRLPTETEWECAARGGDGREYPYGNAFDPQKANTHESNIGHTTAVDAYRHEDNAYGLCDMAGNVEEWVDTLYSPYPGGHPVCDDLVDALGESYYVLRGGSFARGGDLSRCARRHGPFPAPEFKYTGFRLAYSL